MAETYIRQRRTLAGAGTDVRRCSDTLGTRKIPPDKQARRHPRLPRHPLRS
jgi:hypothetical protein